VPFILRCSWDCDALKLVRADPPAEWAASIGSESALRYAWCATDLAFRANFAATGATPLAMSAADAPRSHTNDFRLAHPVKRMAHRAQRHRTCAWKLQLVEQAVQRRQDGPADSQRGPAIAFRLYVTLPVLDIGPDGRTIPPWNIGWTPLRRICLPT